MAEARPAIVRRLLAEVGYDDAWHESRIVRTCGMLPSVGEGARLLDLGTDPRVLHVLTQVGGYAHAEGVRRDETRAGHWTEDVRSTPPTGYTIYNCDLQRDRIPVDSESVDVVTCLETIEHLLDPMKMLIEANRVLKPGGRIILSTPNVLSWDTLVRSARRQHPMHYPVLFPDCYTNRHNIEYTPTQIMSLLSTAGFRATVETQQVWGWKVWTLRKLLFVLGGIDPRGRGDIILADGCKTGPPALRWDPTVYALSAEQEARNEAAVAT